MIECSLKFEGENYFVTFFFKIKIELDSSFIVFQFLKFFKENKGLITKISDLKDLEVCNQREAQVSRICSTKLRFDRRKGAEILNLPIVS